MTLRPLRQLLLALIITVGWASPGFADVIISEFVASNQNGLTDEDGDTSDWIELYNNGSTIVNLSGWALTDNVADQAQWLFPAVTLEPKGFMTVFASSKNRVIAGQVLHTNFKLSADGGYLALVRADHTLATEFTAYPAQYNDKPYGFAQTLNTTSFVGTSAALKYFIPTNNTLGTTWTARTFSDSSWTSGTNGVGYVSSVPGFLFKTWFANVSVGSIATANGVIATPAQQTAFFQQTMPVVNYMDLSAEGHYATNSNPPWLGNGVDHDNYVVEATGIITIPAAGVYTFGVNSDDGFQLQVGPVGGALTTVCQFDGARGAADTVGAFTFAAAGDYQIRVMIFEGAGGSGGEAFAAAGNKTAWDSTFRLIGDTAGGGLAVRSTPASTSAASLLGFVQTNVQTAMLNVSPSAYIRYSFNVANPATVTSLSMPIHYDDGFIVWLNGTEVARRNAPAGTPTNAFAATAAHPDSLGLQYETIDLTPAVGQLVAGTNVVAIQGLNVAANNGDFLIQPEVAMYGVTTANTANYFNAATPTAFNTSTIYNKVAPVVASVTHGFYTTTQSVALTCGTAGAAIRYTFDSSTPTLANPTAVTYSGPISISGTTVLRYAAFLNGADPSEVGTQTYIFLSDVIHQSPTGAPPVISNPGGATQATTTWPANPLTSNPNFTVENQLLDYGMDPDIVNSATYSSTIVNDLKSIPTFSIVTDLPYMFDPNIGIYANPHRDAGDADPFSPGNEWERQASVELIFPDGTVGFQTKCGLRVRGGFSRDPNNPKHGFRLFFSDEFGPGQLKYPLFGTSSSVAQTFAKFDLRCSENYSWSYGGDSTGIFIQDPLCRDLQLAEGEASSHGGFYHLYVNGQYWGLYNIDERPEANFGASYFGGNANDYDTIKVAPENGYTIYPTDGDTNAWYSLWSQADAGLVQGSTPAILAANNTTFQKLIGNNPDGTPNAAYPVLLDPVNTIDYMLAIYYGGNLDAAISNFLSNAAPNNFFSMRDRLGVTGGFKSVLHDSEHTFLNINENRTGPWVAGSSASQGAATAFTKSSPQYIFQQCIYAQEFKTLFIDRVYKNFYNNGPFTPARVTAMFDARKNEIDRAVVGESARWGDAKVATPYTRDTWLTAINNTRTNYLPGRTAIVIGQFRTRGWYPSFDPPVFNQRGGSVANGFNVTLTNPNTNTAGQVIYYTLDGTDPRAFGGGISTSAIAYSAPISIVTSKQIRTRIKSTTDWSAEDDAIFYPAQDLTGLFISEIHYHPLPNGATSGDEYEFLEFKNSSANTLDLGGLNFTSGLTYSFPANTSLAPGAFYVLARNATAFHTRYPAITANGVYTGKLSNSGDRITLVTAAGGTVLDFNYKDHAPWPVTADGPGFSLVTKNPNSNPNPDDANNWRASANIGGSPGADDPAVNYPAVVINEALTNSGAPLTDTIEIYNFGATPADVSNWWLSDDTGTPQKYRIPANTTIPAGGYISFNEAQFNPTPGSGTSFALDQNGEQVYLFSSDVSGNLTGYSHGFEFDAAEQNVSFGRYVNSIGEESFPRQISRTFGSANSGPLVGPVVISEIMYAPYPGFDEFVEIRNLSGAAIPLYDAANPADTWRISGLGFNFPQNVTLAANATALVVPIDPATFRTKYNISAAVQIFGPYTGTLDDTGERLSLDEPAPPIPGSPPTVPYIVIDSVHYKPTSPWPNTAAGTGPSLQRQTLNAFGDDPANWFASGSTPGQANSTDVPPAIAITAPANNASFILPASITFQSATSDTDGTVIKVEYYIDGGKVGESTTGPAFSYAWTGTGGVHTLTAKAIDNGLSVTTSAPITIYATTPVTHGLKGDYYSNMTLGGIPAGTRTDATINFSAAVGAWPSNTGFPGMTNTGFSVRWSGQLFALTTGTYTLSTFNDDGLRMYVNGTQGINDWVDHTSQTTNNYNVNLTAGTLNTFVIEYYQNSGAGTARLFWKPPGGSLTSLPSANLYPDGPPFIAVQPATPVTVAQGAPASFTVLSAGTGPLAYQWRKAGVNIAGATGATLNFPAAQASDTGSYSVLITNISGFAISNNATLTVTVTDTDGDGIPDDWETAHGLNPNDPNDASLDPDGDGFTNLQEYLAGTDPHDASSKLTVTVTKSGANYIINFTQAANKDYTIQYKNALGDATWTKLTDIAASATQQPVQYTDSTVGANATRFYRVVTPKQ